MERKNNNYFVEMNKKQNLIETTLNLFPNAEIIETRNINYGKKSDFNRPAWMSSGRETARKEAGRATTSGGKKKRKRGSESYDLFDIDCPGGGK